MPTKKLTKKKAIDFKMGITSILESHGLHLEQDQLSPLLSDLEIYFNETFRPDNSTVYWSELVSHWLAFYFEIVGEKPEFTAIEAINLKRINKVLKHRYMEAVINGVWDKQTCLRQQELYYRSAITIDFYKQNLSLTILYSKFNEITSRLSAIRKKQKENLVS